MHAVYVGRVGALAVALGVGTAILGLTAVAAADTGSGNSAGATGDEATHAADSGPATAKTRGGNRRGAPDATPGAGGDTGAVTSSRRAAGLRSGVAATGVQGRSGGLSPAAVPQSPADLIGTLLTPGGMTGLVQDALLSLIGTALSGVPVGDLASEATTAPATTPSIQVTEAATQVAPVMTAQPDTSSVTTSASLDSLGGGSGGGDPLAAPLAWAAMAVTQRESQAAATEVASAATVTTGAPVDPAAGDLAATDYQQFPDLPKPASTQPRIELLSLRPTIVNNLASTFANAFQLAAPQSCVSGKGCPLEGNPPAVSVSNTVGMYGFNVVYALVGNLDDAEVAKTVQQLASQSVILDFISQTVAARFSNLPPDVASLIGTAASTFVRNTFGSTAGPAGQPNYVDLKFVPFLKALNLPTGLGLTPFLEACKKDASAAILKRFDSAQQVIGRDALVGFFSNAGVQGYLGSAFAASINVMLTSTFANYLGETAATAILGAGNSQIQPLGATIGNAIWGLFSSIGSIVATQAGNAFGTTFLNQPGIPTVLSNATVNGFVTFLSPKSPPGPTPDIPFPQGELQPLIAPAAGTAVTSFVNSLFTAPNLQPVTAGLDQFVNTLIPGMLANPGVQKKLGDAAAGGIDNPVIAGAVGGAVANLVAVPAVQTALATAVSGLFGSILRSPQALAALSSAAGDWVEADLAGTLDEAKKKKIIDGVRTNSAIDTAVGQAVSSGVTALFGNAEVLSAVNNEAVSLVTVLLSDPTAQTAIGAQVATNVAKIFKTDPELGQAVGNQAGAAVVDLLSNPAIRSALVGLVDTMAGDFFKTSGVVSAFATVAGALASANLAEDPTAAEAAKAAFKANADVQNAVSVAVGGAVRTLLTDPGVLAGLDHAASSLVNGLLNSADVRARLSTAVATEVSTLLGGGRLGQAVGEKAGNAVADLLSQQAVQTALAGLVDTELGDFFQAPGVVDAFVAAADTFALDTLAGDSNAAKSAVDTLRASTAVQGAVGRIVATSVSELLRDSALWSAFDGAASNLVARLLADPAVQDGVSDRISTSFGTTDFGVAVGHQVAATVVNLMKNPAISAGLVGLVDTVFHDFFDSTSVVSAFAIAAGELAAAAVAGDVQSVEKAVLEELRVNPAVQAAVNQAVGDAVTALLTDPNVVTALNDSLASLASALLGDPDVQEGLRTDIAAGVSTFLGGGALGDSVGRQVGIAVVEILSNPIVKDALEGLVDTELGDFFRATGVVDAFAAAADTFALDLVTGGSVKASAEQAVDQLRTSTAVDTAVQGIVTASVAELLGNEQVWSAVDGTTSRLVADLLTNTDVQNEVAGRAYAIVWKAFNGTALGEAVGNQVADAVVAFMQNPDVRVVLVELVDTTSVDFFGYQGVVAAFSTAAGELAAAAVAGDLKTVAPEVQKQLRENTAVDQATGVAVGDAVEALLTDPKALAALDDTAADFVNGLLADPTVEATLQTQVAADVSKILGGGTLGQSVGDQVANAAVNFLSNPNVQAVLRSLVDTELGDFFTSSGVVDAFVAAANTFAVEVVTGADLKTALDEQVAWLRANAAVDDAVSGIVAEGVANVLGNTNVIGAFDDELTTLLTGLRPYAGQIVSLLVTKSLGTSPIAVPVGQAIGAAVQQLLETPGFGSGVVTIITSLLPDFLGQFGVPTALGEIAGQYAATFVATDNSKDAEKAAITALTASPALKSAAKTTIADTLDLINLTLLSVPAIQQALGSTIATLITTLAPEPAIQALFSTPLAEVLANTAVIGEVAPAVGSAITGLLAYPGFNTAFLGAVNLYADDVIDGASVSEAQQSALPAFRSNPTTVSAVNSVIPPAVSGLLGYANVREAAGLYAREETIASLQKSRFNIGFLDETAGQVAEGTVTSLLTRPAGISLADNLAVNLLLGMRLSDWRGFTIQQIIARPELQIAFGMSLGQGVGSLFGDNVIGQLIGVGVGVPATLAVGIGSAFLGVVEWLLRVPSYAVTPPASAAQSVAGESHHVGAANAVMVINPARVPISA